jgi:hypothetical protein
MRAPAFWQTAGLLPALLAPASFAAAGGWAAGPRAAWTRR